MLEVDVSRRATVVRGAVLRAALWGGVLVAATAAFFAANRAVAVAWPGGEALRFPWEATRAFLFRGENPYHHLTLLYAWAARDGVQMPPQTYPLPMALIFFLPLALLRDFTLVRTVAMTGAGVALVGAVVYLGRAWRWRMGWPWGIGVGAFVVLNYFSAAAWLRGDVALLLSALVLGMASALLQHRDDLVGLLLALLWVKPSVALPVTLFVLLWAASRRRWRVWRAFLGVTAVLAALATWLLPSWWLDVVRLRLYLGAPLAPPAVLAQALPGIGRQLGLLVVGIAVALAVGEGIAAWGKSSTHAQWTLALVLAAAVLGNGRMAVGAQALLMLPWLLVGMYWSTAWRAYGRYAMGGLFLLGLLLPWWLWGERLFTTGWPSAGERFVAPLVAVVLLYLVRWWAVRERAVLLAEAWLE